MADKKTDTAPTSAELEAAQAVMRRHQEAQQREADARLQPLRDITAMPEFGALREKVEALPVEMLGDMNVGPHIMAFRSGLNGLATLAPPPAPEAQAPAPAPAPSGGASA